MTEETDDGVVVTSFSEVYAYDLGGVKCGFCNYKTQRHYIIAASQEEADDLMEHNSGDVEKKGFCAECLVREIIMDQRNDEPNYKLIKVDDND